jgi:hypothetical protein
MYMGAAKPTNDVLLAFVIAIPSGDKYFVAWSGNKISPIAVAIRIAATVLSPSKIDSCARLRP